MLIHRVSCYGSTAPFVRVLYFDLPLEKIGGSYVPNTLSYLFPTFFYSTVFSLQSYLVPAFFLTYLFSVLPFQTDQTARRSANLSYIHKKCRLTSFVVIIRPTISRWCDKLKVFSRRWSEVNSKKYVNLRQRVEQQHKLTLHRKKNSQENWNGRC